MITSVIEEEGHGQGKGHTSHGNGKGLGHQKHAENAMQDGIYTIDISGIHHVNHTTVDQTTPQTVLADGSKMNTEVRSGSITIDAPFQGAETALHLVTDSDNGRLRLNDQFSSAQQISLGDLDTLNFDYFIQSSSRTDVIPVIRIAVDADGSLATTADRGELVFEYAYQGFGLTTTGTWQQADLTTWNAWQRSNGANHDVYPDIVPLSDWADADGYTPTGGIHFDENSLLLGWSVALGSGNGTNNMFLDQLKVGGVTYDFV